MQKERESMALARTRIHRCANGVGNAACVHAYHRAGSDGSIWERIVRHKAPVTEQRDSSLFQAVSSAASRQLLRSFYAASGQLLGSF
jgi:hypothetical protein